MLCLHMPRYSEERIPEFKIHGFWLFSIWTELEKAISCVHIRFTVLCCTWCLRWLFPRGSKTNSFCELSLVHIGDVWHVVSLPAACAASLPAGAAVTVFECLVHGWKIDLPMCENSVSLTLKKNPVKQRERQNCGISLVHMQLDFSGTWKMHGGFQRIMR